MTIVERAKRKAARRERWDTASRALKQIKNNAVEADLFWRYYRYEEYFRLMDLNDVLLVTYNKNRYTWRDYLEEAKDFFWGIL